jgi:uncharacterized membrane protein
MSDESTSTHDLPPSSANQAWTFRGYRLRSEEFTNAMLHLYRGEMERSNIWRTRLDQTSNWAMAMTGAAIVLAFSGLGVNHGVVILMTVLVTWFLFIEARRYRYYELWSYRVRLMETDFFAAMLVPPFAPSSDWAESLAHSLLQPDFSISTWEAVGRRFRRNYLWLYFILASTWLLNVALYPVPASAWEQLVTRAAIGPISGTVVLAAGVIFNALLFLMGLLTAGLQSASGEVLPKYGEVPLIRPWFAPKAPVPPSSRGPAGVTARERLSRPRRQMLTFIVAAKPKQLATRILKEMKRGVTALHGTGMYTEQERDVLMVAATVTEMAHLKTLVNAEDPNAFVVITPTQDVIGRGFRPLKI